MNYDLFGAPPTLKIDGRNNTPTKLGVFMTVLFLICIIGAVGIFSRQLTTRSNPTLATYELFHSVTNQGFLLNSGDFILGLSTYDHTFVFNRSIYTVIYGNGTELPYQYYETANGYSGIAYYIPEA